MFPRRYTYTRKMYGKEFLLILLYKDLRLIEPVFRIFTFDSLHYFTLPSHLGFEFSQFTLELNFIIVFVDVIIYNKFVSFKINFPEIRYILNFHYSLYVLLTFVYCFYGIVHFRPYRLSLQWSHSYYYSFRKYKNRFYIRFYI